MRLLCVEGRENGTGCNCLGFEDNWRSDRGFQDRKMGKEREMKCKQLNAMKTEVFELDDRRRFRLMISVDRREGVKLNGLIREN